MSSWSGLSIMRGNSFVSHICRHDVHVIACVLLAVIFFLVRPYPIKYGVRQIVSTLCFGVLKPQLVLFQIHIRRYMEMSNSKDREVLVYWLSLLDAGRQHSVTMMGTCGSRQSVISLSTGLQLLCGWSHNTFPPFTLLEKTQTTVVLTATLVQIITAFFNVMLLLWNRRRKNIVMYSDK